MDVRGCTYSTCIQLRIPSILCPFKRIYVHFSLDSFTVADIRKFRGRKISICVQLRIPLSYLRPFLGLYPELRIIILYTLVDSTTLRLSVCVSQGSWEVWVFHPTGQTDYVLASLISLTYFCQIYVGFTNILFCEKLSFNPFIRTFVHFTIVLLTWYYFTSYSILLPMSISALVFRLGGICLRCMNIFQKCNG